MKILIATTNPGKFKELVSEFADLPFDFVSLNDVKLSHLEPAEPHATTWQNALEKAKFFGDKSKLLTIADDTGFFIKGLGGDPGVKAKRYANTPGEAVAKVLQALKNSKNRSREAYFESSGCIYNPIKKDFTIFKGRVNGQIGSKIVGQAGKGLIYDVIFYYPPLKKYFSELTLAEKNLVSHRGQVAYQIINYLNRMYGFKQIIAPISLIVKDRKMLIMKRRDSRKEFNNKWEFAGGGVENGETIEQCLIRETQEESGYKVKIVHQLKGIATATRKQGKGNYQVFVICFLCIPVSGELKITDNEHSDARWCTLNEALKADLMPLNKSLVRSNIKLLKQYLD